MILSRNGTAVDLTLIDSLFSFHLSVY